MGFISCEINLGLNCSKICVKVATAVPNKEATFSISDTKLYALVVTLSTQDNAKLLEYLTGINMKQKINRKTKSIF